MGLSIARVRLINEFSLGSVFFGRILVIGLQQHHIISPMMFFKTLGFLMLASADQHLRSKDPTWTRRTQEASSCNICGEGNSIQYPIGIVEFEYEGERFKNNCQTLQKMVENRNILGISKEYCQELLQYTHRVCRCSTADGQAVEWTPMDSNEAEEPTMEPKEAEESKDTEECTFTFLVIRTF